MPRNTMPRVHISRVSMGNRIIPYSYAQHQQIKYQIPGVSFLSIRRHLYTLYAQNSIEPAGRFGAKLYNLIARGNIVPALNFPDTMLAMVILLKGEIRLNISSLNNVNLGESTPGLLSLPSGLLKVVFPAGEYQILLIPIDSNFIKTHAMVHTFIADIQSTSLAGRAFLETIPFTKPIEMLITQLKHLLSRKTKDVALNKCLFDAYIMQLIVHAFREISNPTKQDHEVVPQEIRKKNMVRVKEYMDKYFQTPITLSSIASACQVDIDQIGRDFHLLEGKNPGEYLEEKRVKYAAVLLKSCDYTMAKIAEETGFKNSGFMTAAFEKYYNCSPMDYRTKEKNKWQEYLKKTH